MRAMILAAGLATRLQPLSFVRPKVLAPLGGSRILDFWVARLAGEGASSIVVNAHLLAGRLAGVVAGAPWPVPIAVSQEDTLLGTAGGIRHALDLLGSGPFLVVNGDILCNAPLREFAGAHARSGAAVSLLCHDFPMFNAVAISPEDRVLEFGESARTLARRDPTVRLRAFTGIHMAHPEVFSGIPAGASADLVSLWRERIASGDPPRAVVGDGFLWREMGTIPAYLDLHRELPGFPPGVFSPVATGRDAVLHETAHAAEDAVFSGAVTLGAASRVLDGARLQDVLAWDGVTIMAGADLSECILADGARVSGTHSRMVFWGGKSWPIS